MPLDALGYHALLLRHAAWFIIWSKTQSDWYGLSEAQVRRLRRTLREAGLMFQTLYKLQTLSLHLQSPVAATQRPAYQRLLDGQMREYYKIRKAFRGYRSRHLGQLLRQLAGNMIGKEVRIEQSKLKPLIAAAGGVQGLKLVGLYATLKATIAPGANMPTAEVAKLAGLSLPTTRKYCKHLADVKAVIYSKGVVTMPKAVS